MHNDELLNDGGLLMSTKDISFRTKLSILVVGTSSSLLIKDVRSSRHINAIGIPVSISPEQVIRNNFGFSHYTFITLAKLCFYDKFPFVCLPLNRYLYYIGPL